MLACRLICRMGQSILRTSEIRVHSRQPFRQRKAELAFLFRLNQGFSKVDVLLFSTLLRRAYLIVCKVLARRRRAKTLHTIKKKARLRAKPDEGTTFEKLCNLMKKT